MPVASRLLTSLSQAVPTGDDEFSPALLVPAVTALSVKAARNIMLHNSFDIKACVGRIEELLPTMYSLILLKTIRKISSGLFASKPLYQAGSNQAEKGLGIGEQPAEVRGTVGAEHHLPAKSRKPSELVGRLTVWGDTRSLVEAAQFKGNSCRIEKGVFMSIIDPQRLAGIGDNGAADPAENGMISLLIRRVDGPWLRCPGITGGKMVSAMPGCNLNRSVWRLFSPGNG